jgi:hypothetical protein
MVLPPEFYEQAYEILVELGGAPPSMKSNFVHSFSTDKRTSEWRFQGKLGFGGKFWRRPNGHDVTCYTEDLTTETGKLVQTLNERIATLERNFKPTLKP